MNKWKDDGWRVSTWMWVAAILVAFGFTMYWVAISKTPDMPFTLWLSQATRDDVWAYGFSCIMCGVGAARFMVRTK
jgi:hypothetical protein